MELVLSDTKESIGEKLMKNHYKKDIQSEILTENKVWLQNDQENKKVVKADSLLACFDQSMVTDSQLSKATNAWKTGKKNSNETALGK